MSSSESNSNNFIELLNSIKDMENIEKELIIRNQCNIDKINDYIVLLEEIINEYHILSMKIFNC